MMSRAADNAPFVAAPDGSGLPAVSRSSPPE